MQLFVPVLAEVGDKVPRLPVLFLWCAGITLLAWLVTRKKKWLAVVPLPLAAVFAIGATQEPRDPFVGPAIIHEFGYGYVATSYFFAAVPFVVIAWLVFQAKKEPNQSPEPTAPSGRGSS